MYVTQNENAGDTMRVTGAVRARGSTLPLSGLVIWKPLTVSARFTIRRALRPRAHGLLLAGLQQRNRRGHGVPVYGAVRLGFPDNLEVLHDVPSLS